MSPGVSPGAVAGWLCCLERCQPRERLWVCLPSLLSRARGLSQLPGACVILHGAPASESRKKIQL